jgi:hypothetical protein
MAMLSPESEAFAKKVTALFEEGVRTGAIRLGIVGVLFPQDPASRFNSVRTMTRGAARPSEIRTMADDMSGDLHRWVDEQEKASQQKKKEAPRGN